MGQTRGRGKREECDEKGESVSAVITKQVSAKRAHAAASMGALLYSAGVNTKNSEILSGIAATSSPSSTELRRVSNPTQSRFHEQKPSHAQVGKQNTKACQTM